MSGTNVVAAKQRLVAVFTTLFADVKVSYSYVGKLADANRDYLFLGASTQSPVALMAFKDDDDGRVQRSEEPTVPFVIEVFKPGEETVEQSELRAVELGALAETYIATNTTLGDLPDLKLAQITNFRLQSYVDDDGSHTTLEYTVQLKSHLR